MNDTDVSNPIEGSEASPPAPAPAGVLAIVEAARAKQAIDIKVLDLRGVATFSDFFVIMTGSNIRQVQAISDGIVRRLRADHVGVTHVEGYTQGDWILIDCSDIVVHVFSAVKRSVYDLERLWSDAPVIDYPEAAA